jgi:hypothetical protein
MSAANPNPMEKSMVSLLVVANAGGGVAVAVSVNDTENICTDLLSKVSAFQVLFPEPPQAPPSRKTRCHPELPWQTFSPAEIRQAIFTSLPKKAPGPDAITFACL